MNKHKLPLSQHFSSLRKKGKWILKLIFVIVIFSLSSIISMYTTDINKMYKESLGSNANIEEINSIVKTFSIIGSPFLAIFSILLTFFIFFIISKIMKSNTNAKSIFSATLSYKLITGIIGFVVILIQWSTNLSPNEYTITSLNVFDKGNQVLGAFDFQVLIGAYIFSVFLFFTNELSKKSTIIWSIIYTIVLIALPIINVIL